MTAAANSEQRIAAARRSGDADGLAEALVAHADTLVPLGHLAAARAALDEAATIHGQQGRPYDDARCTLFAATLCRLEGQREAAQIRAARAETLAEVGSPLAVSAATELGEIALANSDGAAAVAAYSRALAASSSAGLVPAGRAALLRKQAVALMLIGRPTEAAATIGQAQALLQAAGFPAEALKASIEQISALHAAGDGPGATRVRTTALASATALGDHAALAELHMLAAAQALAANDAPTASAALQAARQESLAAPAPLSYIAAALAIAELAESQGNRLDAYAALATGWATLGDLLGRAAAKATFEPKLLAQRERWGAAAFAATKATYEAQRRASRAADDGR